MVNYDYICQHCDHEMRNVMQSIKDKPKKVCPNCGKHKLKRVLYGGEFCSVSKDPSTIGQLADKNARKAGRQKMSEIVSQSKENAPAPESPLSRHCTATDREVRAMTDQQRIRYIMEGKK
jgi:putative FmdB family regulatory protein